jgi:serine/threonine-protein kinase RsbW
MSLPDHTGRFVKDQIFPGTLASLEPIRRYIEATARAAGLDLGATYRLCLAVDEIATNVVIHGYEEAGLAGDLNIKGSVQGDSLIVELEDHGQRYHPDFQISIQPNEQGLPLESREIGGLGIPLARDNVDEIQYSTTDGSNVHRLFMRLPTKQGQGAGPA